MIIQYENGTIKIESDGEPINPAMPILREVAAKLGVSLLNSAGGVRNTRQLGAEIITTLNFAAGQTGSSTSL